MVLLKVEESLWVCGAKAIDALVLISNQKQVSAVMGQQGDDAVLDFGGILCLIHAEVVIPMLKVAQHRRT